MPSDADAMTIWRNYGGQSSTVRGVVDMSVSGDTLVTDYEVPLGVDVTYTCQTFDVSGIPSALSPPSAVVNLAVTSAWAQDPLDPSSANEWPLRSPGATVMKLGSLSGYAFRADQALTTTVGSTLPIGMSGVRRDAGSIPVVIATSSGAAHDGLQALLRQAGANLCLRLPVKVPILPRVSYLQIGDITPVMDPNWLRVVWSFVGTSIEGPALNIIIPVRTYDQLASEAATYSGLTALYATYLDAQRGL